MNTPIVNRRELLQSVLLAGAAGAGLLSFAERLCAGIPQTTGSIRRVTDTLSVITNVGTNVVAFSSGDSFVFVDSGAPEFHDRLKTEIAALTGSKRIEAVFNTHYHLDQTAGNDIFSAVGARIIAHENTKQWLSNDYWVPALDRYEKARPAAAWPTETFRTTGSMKAGPEQIDYGYLIEAHTNSDIYVFFKNANVIAVGDVVSPQRDPSLDYFTGAWIGGRVDAMDVLLTISNAQTRFIPAVGDVMTQAEVKAERDVMNTLLERLIDHVREGEGPEDMLKARVMDGLPRKWDNPGKFLYDAAKGLWAHHNKLNANVV